MRELSVICADLLGCAAMAVILMSNVGLITHLSLKITLAKVSAYGLCVDHNQVHARLNVTWIAVDVWDISLKQDRISCG